MIFRAHLADQSMDHLSSSLKRGGFKDLIDFFPPNKRNITTLDTYFRDKGLPVVAEWYAKKRFAVVKEVVVNGLKDLSEKEEGVEAVRILRLESGFGC
jgi:predicted AAA+ superfamily ATPase